MGVDTTCPDCGGPSVSRTAARPRLCAECARSRRRRVVHAYKDSHREEMRTKWQIVITRDMTCLSCGEGFVRAGNRGPIPKWCEPCKTVRMAEQAAEFRRRHPERVLTLAKRGGARRRAVSRDITADKVERLIVFDRDRWTCQLCNMPVFRVFRWPAPWSASLDHVLPLSRGGEHTYQNTQLAHLRCNLRKSNKAVA